jgi:phenylalanine-4-hydroxylase
MAQNNLVQPVAAAATSQVKFFPYNEEEPHIWFHLIEAQFALAGIRSQKLKYANALANLPNQVLRDILDTIDVCNDSDQPFDHLKEVLL